MLTRASDGLGRWVVARCSELAIELVDEKEREASAHRLHADLSHEHFYVQFYLTAEHHPSPVLYRTLTLGHSHTDVILPRHAPDHTPLIVLLYLARPNEDKEMCGFLAGRALVPFRDLTKGLISVDAKDERGSLVARVEFACRVERKDLLKWTPSESQPDEVFPRKTEFEWSNTGFHEDGTFILDGTVYTPSVPALSELVALKTASFLSPHTPKWMLAHLTEPDSFTTPASFWSHAVKIACSMLDITVEEFIAAPIDHLEVYGQVLGLVPWQVPYLADACFDGSSFEMCGR
jgi:hypothetical protein